MDLNIFRSKYALKLPGKSMGIQICNITCSRSNVASYNEKVLTNVVSLHNTIQEPDWSIRYFTVPKKNIIQNNCYCRT